MHVVEEHWTMPEERICFGTYTVSDLLATAAYLFSPVRRHLAVAVLMLSIESFIFAELIVFDACFDSKAAHDHESRQTSKDLADLIMSCLIPRRAPDGGRGGRGESIEVDSGCRRQSNPSQDLPS